MDKRTLIFVIGLTLSLFLVQQYFQYQGDVQNRELNQQAKVKKAAKFEALKKEITGRTAKAEALPLVALYKDSAQSESLTEGIEQNNGIITVAWTEPTPSTIYANSKQYTLINKPEKVGDLAIFSSDKEPLLIGNLPDFGVFDIQVVSFNPTHITLGELSDGHFILGQEKLNQLSETKEKFDQNNAIGLLKTLDGYFPVAYYQAATKSFVALDKIPAIAAHIKKPEVKKAIASNQKVEEKFYVLENDYQQLVFSNYGGALVEINLPFKTTTNTKSVVREIDFDRDMVKEHPYNAHFPSHRYYTHGKEAKTGFVEHPEGQLGGYYPLLRRDLIENALRKTTRIKPEYYALNLVSEYPEVAELVYEVTYFDANKIVLEASQPHRKIIKTFSFEPESDAPYCLNLNLQVEGDSRGLWITSGVPEVEWISGGTAPALKYRITRNNEPDVENVDLPKDSITFSSVRPDWACNSNGFLGMILDPLTEIETGIKANLIPGNSVPTRLLEIDQKYNLFKAANLPGYEILLPLKNNGGTMNFRLFAGPFSSEILKTIDKVYSNPETGYNPDYIACQTYHGWFTFISEPFAKFLFILMKFFHYLTGSWGISIILLTIALRIMMYPLNAWSTKSMIRMQQIAPEVTAIQEKHKKDPKAAQLEIMNLYREKGVNPISGCFPLLIQMPFLIGMFDLLKSTFELRGVPFIPGWIDNLTAPDVLFSWGMPIYFIGNQFHLLPVLLGAVMFFQQRMMATAPVDPNAMTEQQKQQKMMGNVMTVVFTIMFYNFPSGLNIYWLSSMLLGILQQWWTQRQIKLKVGSEPKIVKSSNKKLSKN